MLISSCALFFFLQICVHCIDVVATVVEINSIKFNSVEEKFTHSFMLDPAQIFAAGFRTIANFLIL